MKHIWYFIRGLFLFPLLVLGIILLLPITILEGIWIFGSNEDFFWYTPILERWFKIINNLKG